MAECLKTVRQVTAFAARFEHGEHLPVGMKIGTVTKGVNMVVPQNQSISKHSYTMLGDIPKGHQSYHRETCSAMFTAVLFAIARI